MDSYGYLGDFQWRPEVVQKRSGVEERDFHDRAGLGWAAFDVKASSWADLKAPFTPIGVISRLCAIQYFTAVNLVRSVNTLLNASEIVRSYFI
jgi:hypothetical protein